MTKASPAVTLALLLCLFALPIAAEAPDAKGLRIARAADIADAGFDSYVVSGAMTLRDHAGGSSRRDFTLRVLEVPGDGDKSIIAFHNPPDIKGTALLTFAHVTGDDQWLYLPALKRVKRISASNRSGSFVASEFAYEDISRQQVEEFTYQHVAEEPCPGDGGGQTCHVIDRFPTYPGSGYRQQRVWMDVDEYRIYKIDYYDRKNSLLKTLHAEGYRVYKGKHWRPDRMRMINHQTGKSTDLDWAGYRFDAGLTSSDFTRRSLERVQ